MSIPLSAPEPRGLSPDRARLQDLSVKVLAAEEVEDALALLVDEAAEDLGAVSAALVLPADTGRWAYEIVTGALGPYLLGQEIERSSPLGRALATADAPASEHIAAIRLDARAVGAAVGGAVSGDGGIGQDTGDGRRTIPAALSLVSGGSHGIGALIVFSPACGVPLRVDCRERLDALAMLLGLCLDGIGAAGGESLEDERGRIARDLHDLAIQELFAVGMELESLTGALATEVAAPSDARVRGSVEASVRGVENAVAQIRQVVQSLRRERPEATLSERLRHEAGLATAGLGFAPTLRLPSPPADLDAEVEADVAEDVVAVVRECLANAARHAHASAVAVNITMFWEGVDRVLQVSVSDNGRGIDPAVSRRSGLANMASRARRHSGWVDALELEQGTMINWRVTLPAR
ncbi:sensor histidine kinase [Brachybacterium phenoliresistens]|uniref:sensor histidine kinase n=1 Tax=Brachybacterium phenoliresistens TaxID=396014 RepID=UPI0004BA8783|nr:histidine kinase [Brachybacterium phenoliresistens]